MSTCREGYLLVCNVFRTIACYSSHTRTARPCGKHLGLSKTAVNANRSFTANATSVGQTRIPTLLYKTKAFASQVLPSKHGDVPFTESAEFWEDILASAYDDYQLSEKRPARLVVYGVDQWSCSEDLVTALLSEPLASDDMINEVVRNRHHNRPKEKLLNISYGRNVAVDPESIQVPSTYLQQFTTTIQITEFQSSIEPTKQYLKLFKADFPVIVFNPVTTPLPGLLARRLPNHTILALTSASATESSGKSHPLLASASSRSQAIIYVDPLRAVKALENFRLNSSSPSAIQQHQDNTIGSGVSSVTQIVRNALDITYEADFRHNIILAHLRGALATCQDSLHSTRVDLDEVLVEIASMTTEVEKAQKLVLGDVFGYPYTGQNRWGDVWPPVTHSKLTEEKTNGANVISEALNQAQRQMRIVMENFTWWQMLWHVDEISSLVSASFERTWCPELEKKLTIQTGRLIAFQENFKTRTLLMLEKYKAKPPFNSALLQNALQQKCMSFAYVLSPDALVEPLYKRKKQLNAYATTQLHLRGQRAVIGMGTGIVTSTSFGWAGWLGWLSGSGLNVGTENTLLQALSSTFNIGIDPSMAAGLGALGTLMSIRWTVGKWERAKKRWWEDWTRVCQGLERDLKTTLEKVMKERVTFIAEKGCEGLQQLAKQRQDEIAIFDKDLQTLQAELNELERQVRKR